MMAQLRGAMLASIPENLKTTVVPLTDSPLISVIISNLRTLLMLVSPEEHALLRHEANPTSFLSLEQASMNYLADISTEDLLPAFKFSMPAHFRLLLHSPTPYIDILNAVARIIPKESNFDRHSRCILELNTGNWLNISNSEKSHRANCKSSSSPGILLHATRNRTGGSTAKSNSSSNLSKVSLTPHGISDACFRERIKSAKRKLA
eukprot:IDg15649t1